MADQPSLDPTAPATDLAGYFRRWSELHEGVDPTDNRLIKVWLTCAYRLGRPLAAVGMSANAVTAMGMLLSLTVPLCAWAFIESGAAAWLVLAVAMTAIAGVVDNLDGAVAVITGKTTRWGYVLDSTCDRVSEAAFFIALWIVGAPAGWVVAGLMLGYLQEYMRARTHNVSSTLEVPLTIAERPTRVAIAAVFLGLAAWAPYGRGAASWATIGAIAATVVGVIGFAQLTWAVRRLLR